MVEGHLAVIAIIETILRQANQDQSPSSSRFDSSDIPEISVRSYLTRISSLLDCESSIYTMSLVYMDRIVEKTPQLMITPLNVHRLILTSITLAHKFYSDFYYRNTDYAAIGGVSSEDMNKLESRFLKMIGFNLYISNELFHEYESKLLIFMQLQQEEKMKNEVCCEEKTEVNQDEQESSGRISTCGSYESLVGKVEENIEEDVE